MDVLVLIDKLDDLVHNAKAVPLTDQVRIDREEIYDILDQMRATIPEEIKQARWIVKERQEMLAEAKREVDRLLAEAREQAVREASQTEIVKIAERQAQAKADCDEGGTFLKRVIGLPGEQVSERDGVFYVDGKKLHESYLSPSARDAVTMTWGRLGPKDYFVMGDNRTASCDSRTWGAVPRGKFIGPVMATYW